MELHQQDISKAQVPFGQVLGREQSPALTVSHLACIQAMLLLTSSTAGVPREAQLSRWQGPALPCRLQQSTARQRHLHGHGRTKGMGTSTRLPEAGRVLSAARSTLQAVCAHTAPAAAAERRLKLRAFAKPAVGALALLALSLLMPSSSQASTAASGGQSFLDGATRAQGV